VLDEHRLSFSQWKEPSHRVWQVVRVHTHELSLQLWRDVDLGIPIEVLDMNFDVVEESLDATGDGVVALRLVEMLFPIAGNAAYCCN
jgi:hypothetical protein